MAGAPLSLGCCELILGIGNIGPALIVAAADRGFLLVSVIETHHVVRALSASTPFNGLLLTFGLSLIMGAVRAK